MKNLIIYIFIIFCCVLPGFVSCEKDFLQKPMGNDIYVDTVFSKQENAMYAIAQAYSNAAASGIQAQQWDNERRFLMQVGTLTEVSGEALACITPTDDLYRINRSGLSADASMLSGSIIVQRPLTIDGFRFNYASIRSCFLVLENIDKVKDMTPDQKKEVKAEMKTLIAYRYAQMFIRYGGVPIVTKSLLPDDDIMIPRANLEKLLKHIVDLCDEAIPDLPDKHPDRYRGRATKGVALATKAEALLFAARPLFNSATPYLDLGSNNELICFGNYSEQRWHDAIAASEAVIDWAINRGGHEIITTIGTPLENYATAVATPGNKEVLWAYQRLEQNSTNASYNPRSERGANGMSFWMMSQYVKADGSDQIWPTDGEEESYAIYNQKIEAMEARYKASAAGAGIHAWNNQNNNAFSSQALANSSTWSNAYQLECCGKRVKYWYNCGTRDWFEYPIFRLAEFYLDLAEAYNEVGNNAKALANLNVTRSRAGLYDISETDKDLLRKIIRRERAVELFEEGHSIWDVRHWKHEDIGNGIIGGPRKSFKYRYTSPSILKGRNPADYAGFTVETIYQGFWAQNQYLLPFPLQEINKGYLVQNPGY